MRRRFLCQVFLFLIFLSPRANGLEINLAPTFLYQSDESGSRLQILGPLIERTPERLALRPFYYHDSERTEILYPSASFTPERSYVYPFYSARSGQDDSRRHWGMFPFYRGSVGEHSYGGFFPFYGEMYSRYGFDYGRFILWPIFSETVTDDVSTYRVMWPFFSYSPERELKFFPFYGQETPPPDDFHCYALWPLFHYRQTRDETMHALLPLYMFRRGPGYHSTSVLWPFFTYNRNEIRSHTSMDILYPLGRYASGAYEEKKIFPFYWEKDKGPSYRMRMILWPIYKRSESMELQSGEITRQTSVLILSGKKVRIDPAGQASSTITVWPFWHSERRDDRYSWQFPYIIPLSHPGYRRNWEPLLTLASGTRTVDTENVNVLWNTFYLKKSKDSRRFALSFIFSHEMTAECQRTGFISDLIMIEN